MNLRDIKYLIAVAEHKHFGKAAQVCHVSQPTLSMQVKKLEEELGVAIFERSNRKVMLTAVGEEVLEQAREVLNASERMVQVAKEYSDPFTGEITLGAFPTLAPYLLPLVMPAIRKACPKLTVNLVEEKTDVLLAQLQEGVVDCALLALPVEGRNMEALPLFDEPFHLAVSKTHALAQRKKIDVTDLDGHTLLLLDEGHCLREQALSVCQRIGAKESQRFRATSLETLRQMVASGHAMTLMPELALFKERNVNYIPFTNPPSRHIGLLYRKTSVRRQLMDKLGGIIKQTVSEYL